MEKKRNGALDGTRRNNISKKAKSCVTHINGESLGHFNALTPSDTPVEDPMGAMEGHRGLMEAQEGKESPRKKKGKKRRDCERVWSMKEGGARQMGR